MSQPKTLTTYYQPWIPGAAYGAAFVAVRGRAQLWGLTRQLIGSRWAGAAGFQYAGSIGPVRLDPARTRTIRRIGDLLADRFSLRGLFGVDLVVDGNDIWTIEVNPRYCASFEILERAGGPPAMAIHMEACRNGTVLDVARPASEACHAKAIIFAQRQLSVTPRTLRLLTGTPARGAWPAVADVPREKTMIQEGHPILTMFAEGASASQAYRQLRVSCQRLRDSLERRLE